MSEALDDPAAVLANLAALSRVRQNDFRVQPLWPDSLLARIKECEHLASVTIYPEMAILMRKLALIWRDMARLLPSQ